MRASPYLRARARVNRNRLVRAIAADILPRLIATMGTMNNTLIAQNHTIESIMRELRALEETMPPGTP